jgi:hypothetical protein
VTVGIATGYVRRIGMPLVQRCVRRPVPLSTPDGRHRAGGRSGAPVEQAHRADAGSWYADAGSV